MSVRRLAYLTTVWYRAEDRLSTLTSSMGPRYAEEVFKIYERVFKWIMARPQPASPNETHDARREILRAEHMYNLFRRLGKRKNGRPCTYILWSCMYAYRFVCISMSFKSRNYVPLESKCKIIIMLLNHSFPLFRIVHFPVHLLLYTENTGWTQDQFRWILSSIFQCIISGL
jgi:hypothetical protein